LLRGNFTSGDPHPQVFVVGEHGGVVGQLLVALAEKTGDAVLNHFAPAPFVLGDDWHAHRHRFQADARPVLASAAIDRQRAMQLAKEVLRRDRHRLETIGPRRCFAEFGMRPLIHAEHQRTLRAILDTLVDWPGGA
jgi:hypothetical protein